MILILKEFTKAHAKEICTWKYAGEYAIYNYPTWNIVCKEKWAITIEEKRKKEMFSLVDDYDNLCGYIRLQNKQESILMGVGLKPNLCGQGLGNILMKIVKNQCKKVYPNKLIVLEVRAFNERAVKCYKKAGFKLKETYKKDTPLGEDEFIRMEYMNID
ncbi:GNAT family N-acetyltransferase [Clostridium felsineum]|uniref:Uncharacterized protein n=1 Tax=Clostridium felsineum TaxID=36839 RepID=A0A1S8L961_9CLOT|nr:GNAT family N-acetyltransferase [Clostridium felsineum]URZ05169.1 hypothetical protein CLROS_004930 [Clostridium felsineum]URZ10210.1 hypothetical protein CROST_009180 [Clostridium felsineum]